MYKMNFKFLGYKLRLEVVVICILLGVVIGSNIGSKEQGEVRNVCSNVTRYNEVQKTSYSHSVLTFEYNGTIQSINFTK